LEACKWSADRILGANVQQHIETIATFKKFDIYPNAYDAFMTFSAQSRN